MNTKKKKYVVSLDLDVAARLDAIGSPHGMTKNEILAAAGYQFSKIHHDELYHALGRIAGPREGGFTLESAPPRALPATRGTKRAELAVSR